MAGIDHDAVVGAVLGPLNVELAAIPTCETQQAEIEADFVEIMEVACLAAITGSADGSVTVGSRAEQGSAEQRGGVSCLPCSDRWSAHQC